MNIQSRPTSPAPRLTLIVCLLLGCLFLVTTTAAQQTISYQAYLAQIGRWREQVRLAQVQNGLNCAQVLGAIADEMANLTAVQMPNGATMSVNHEGIMIALRAAPCDLARADSLLAGICPNQICPVALVPPDTSDPGSNDSLPPANPSQLPGTAAPNAEQQLEELIQASQPAGSGEASTGSGADQSDLNATPASQTESGEPGPEAASPGEPAGSSGEPAGASETPSGAAGEPAAAGSEEAGADSPQTGEAEATGESSSVEEGQAGAAEAAGAAEPGDNAGGSDVAASEAGQTAANGTEGSANETAAAATADTTAAATAEPPPATSPPPEIVPPVESEAPSWLWLTVALAIIIIVIGAILFILSQPGDASETKRRLQEPETAAAAVDEGRDLVAAGNYRGAVRHLFLAALLTLDERNLIQYDKTRTNYEILDEAELRSTIVETLTPVVETFERVWYGFETVGTAEYERLVKQIELLKQA